MEEEIWVNMDEGRGGGEVLKSGTDSILAEKIF